MHYKTISFAQALEYETTRLSDIQLLFINMFGGYEKFALRVQKRYNHYIESKQFAEIESALIQAKELIK